MEDEPEVILVSEKRELVEKINYSIWPGDIKYDKETRGSKRKIDDLDPPESPSQSLNKRACMSNRYFSSENVEKLRNETVVERTSNESDEFVRRRDYLMTKLLKSRSLPGESATGVEDPSPTPQPLMSLNPRSSASASNEEFIRLNEPVLPPNQANNECPLAPYPLSQIKRAADHFKFMFSDQSPFVLYESNQGQRTFEIVKLKVGLRSKFDNDPVMMRRIERDDFAARKAIEDRKKTIDSKSNKTRPNQIIDLCESSSDDKESTDEDEREEIASLIAREDRVNPNEDESSEGGSSSEGTKSEEVEDSRCLQFGKYTESKKPRRGKNASTKNNLSKKVLGGKRKSEGVEQTGGELDELEREYSALRNRKMKLRKKRSKMSFSKVDFEIEKKLLNADMRKLRKSMKKLKHKRTNKPNNAPTVSLGGNAIQNKKKSPKKFANKPNKKFKIIRKPKKTNRFIKYSIR